MGGNFAGNIYRRLPSGCLQFGTAEVDLPKSPKKIQGVKEKNKEKRILKCLCPTPVGSVAPKWLPIIKPIIKSCSSSLTPQILPCCPNGLLWYQIVGGFVWL